jgi:hypothetical protein
MSLAGEAVANIAEVIGRNPKRVYIIRARPHVKAAIADGLRSGLENARAKLAASAGDIAKELVAIGGGAVDEDPKRTAVQVQAARAVIEFAVKLGEFAGDGAPKKSEVSVTGGVAAIPVWSGSQEDFEKAAMAAQEKLQSEAQSEATDEDT